MPDARASISSLQGRFGSWTETRFSQRRSSPCLGLPQVSTLQWGPCEPGSCVSPIGGRERRGEAERGVEMLPHR